MTGRFGPEARSLDELQQSPSFEKILACEETNALLHPALIHVVDVLSGSRFRATRAWPSRYRDEILLCVDLLINAYTLRYFSSSWTEKIHGIVRRYSSDSQLKNLLRSILALAIWPYGLKKLEEFVACLDSTRLLNQSVNRHSHDGKSSNQGLSYVFQRLYPLIKKLFLLLNIRTVIMFLLKKSPYSSFVRQISGVKLSKRSTRDVTESAVKLQGGSAIVRLIHFLFRCLTMVTAAAALFAKLYASSAEDIRALLAASVPPPPRLPILPLRVPDGHCPLCRNAFTNATAAKETGIVFCGSCISSYVRLNKKCPVTGVPLNEDSLIKIL